MNTYPLDKYEKDLTAHDWHYEYAEGECYYNGLYEHARLRDISKQSPEHKAAYDAAWDRYRGGGR